MKTFNSVRDKRDYDLDQCECLACYRKDIKDTPLNCYISSLLWRGVIEIWFGETIVYSCDPSISQAQANQHIQENHKRSYN